jgi:superfamily II DNA or RNA helicase
VSLTLRDYQVEAKAETLAIKPGEPGMIVLPTGTGKTVVFSSAIVERGASALILAHRDELLKQAADKLVEVAPELEMGIGFVKAKLNDVGSSIVVASVQTLASARRLAQLPKEFGLVVVDEAHHAVAVTYQRILEHVSGSPIVGFTATAGRAGLGDHFKLRYSKSLLEMILDGYLSDLRGVRVELDLDLSDVRRSNRGRGDFVDADLGEAMEAADASDRTVDAWREHAADRRGLVFCPTIAVSESMAEAFRKDGVRAAHLDGTTETGRRRAILRELKEGQLDVVCNVGVLTEGFDEPSIDAVVIARPTKSEILYAQMVGRGTRLYPGKLDCLVLDLVGVSDELSLESLPKLIGAKQIREGETATEAVEREDREEVARTEQERIDAEARRKARLKHREFGFFSRDRIHWHEIDDRFAIDVGSNEFVVLDPDEEKVKWRALLLEKDRARVLASNLDLGYAQGVAEGVIRERNAIGVADKDAAWRKRRASKGQLAKARHHGAYVMPGATAGEASDAITNAILSERIQRFDAAVAARSSTPTKERQPA